MIKVSSWADTAIVHWVDVKFASGYDYFLAEFVFFMTFAVFLLLLIKLGGVASELIVRDKGVENHIGFAAPLNFTA